ncbi:MAG TPA: ATP-binding cassette domain-containing protein [Casimicrobiaceae bacterium]|nr:ATP-binding cassette domain-containing protein [Casimicrobiaceae bacterium]
MERSLIRYIVKFTWRDQLAMLVLTAISFPLIYLNLEIPKRIVNSAIGGKHIPPEFLGFPVTQVSYLMGLSLLLLALITLNGGLKYWINVYAGVVGERTMRRLRHDLYQLMLRFPLPHFKTTSAGELIPMIVAETEPIGGFIGESISLPVFQGGLLVTYIVFIFNQDLWLGLAAIALYPPQLYLIPRLQRKINQLNKERVTTARQLSDRIGDSVAGAVEIRGNDTFHLESADISDRLGRIYALRYDIYKRKYFVKFLNNFLGQITPFFFYSAGGYLVIKGSLSLGSLVAVLAAYKDILNPWKELLTWYASKEDVRIKYEQVISQFEPPGLIDRRLVEDPPANIPSLAGPITANGVAYGEDGRASRLDRLTFTVQQGEHVALLGGDQSGKADVTHLIARLIAPNSGRVSVAGVNLADVHQAVPGRRIAYATQNAHITSGSFAHNLYYGLKHAPMRPAAYDEADARREAQRVRDAIAAGNSPLDIRADWIDYAAAGVDDPSQMTSAAVAVLGVVGLERDVIDLGLASLPPEGDAELRVKGLEARERIREAVQTRKFADYVELFDEGAYNTNISVAENLVFGTPRDIQFYPANLARNPQMLSLLRDVGLLDDLYAAGARVAGAMLELFAGVAPDSGLFDQYSFISAIELPEFRKMLGKVAKGRLARITPENRARLLDLVFRIVEAQHRLGVLDEPLQRRIVAARAEFHRRFKGRHDVVEFFEANKFSSTLSIEDNLLFGRLAAEHAGARAHVIALVRDMAIASGMQDTLVQLGLRYEVGIGGARLSYSQRQRLAIARALLKNPDVLVFNEPTSGLEPSAEGRLVRAVLDWAKQRTVIWSLGRADLGREFDRVLVFDNARLVDDGRFDELEKKGNALAGMMP